MPNEETDRIAREAARLLIARRFETVTESIRAAAEALGLDAKPPSHGRVRLHYDVMTEQAVGESGRAERTRRMWAAAEEAMTAMQMTFDDAEPRLMGRAARGEFAGPVQLYIRIHTREPIRAVALTLEDYGYGVARFETADTRFGRFDRIRIEDDECQFVITRCLPEMLYRATVDLYHRKPVESASIEDLQKLLRSDG